MEKYIRQLLEQIEAIILKRWEECVPHFYEVDTLDPYLIPPKGWRPDMQLSSIEKNADLEFQAHIEQVEEWLEGNAEFSMFYHFELKKQLFPPPDRLTDAQLDQLCIALLRLWNAFNLSASIPEKAPNRIVYPALLKRMLKPTMIMNSGINGIEFCYYEPSDCVFGAYCDCGNSFIEMDIAEPEEESKVAKTEEELYEEKRQELLSKLTPEEVAAIEKNIANMDRYVTQVLEDIKEATNNLPQLYPSHKDHDLEKGMDWTAELANSPYKTIEDWTGIQLDVLPSEGHLTGKQIDRLVIGLDALWEAYYFFFDVDLYDPVIRYRMYRDSWEDQVQYLPQSGFEVELCYGDSEDCRMGADCLCFKDPSDIGWEDGPISSMDDLKEDSEDLPF